jgi:hypothetical protein
MYTHTDTQQTQMLQTWGCRSKERGGQKKDNPSAASLNASAGTLGTLGGKTGACHWDRDIEGEAWSGCCLEGLLVTETPSHPPTCTGVQARCLLPEPLAKVGRVCPDWQVS